MMDFTLSNILSGLIFGGVGLWLFREAKRFSNLYLMVIALALMIYPYFSNSVWMDWGGGLALCWLAFEIKKSQR